MIRVKVEIVPRGVEEEAEVLGMLVIANVGDTNILEPVRDGDLMEYAVSLFDDIGERRAVVRHCRSKGWGRLVCRALGAALDNVRYER